MTNELDHAANRTHYVYRCYDQFGDLMYIGCARDVSLRIYHHKALCNAHKVPNGFLRYMMARHTVEPHKTRAAARAAERAAIAAEAPPLNRQNNPTRFRKTAAGGPYVLVHPIHPMTAAAFPELAEDTERTAA